MKKLAFISCLPLWVAITPNAPQADFPKLTGLYLGQKPPGMTLEIFAWGVLPREESQAQRTTGEKDGRGTVRSVIQQGLNERLGGDP